MSYNGIGLSTVRGSATSGYVQKNLAAKHSKHSNIHGKFNKHSNIYESKKYYNTQNEKVTKKLEKREHFVDAELESHEQKRQIELKCVEFREELEDKYESEGKDIDEAAIDAEVSEFKKGLLEQQSKEKSLNYKRYAKASRGFDGSKKNVVATSNMYGNDTPDNAEEKAQQLLDEVFTK